MGILHPGWRYQQGHSPTAKAAETFVVAQDIAIRPPGAPAFGSIVKVSCSTLAGSASFCIGTLPTSYLARWLVWNVSQSLLKISLQTSSVGWIQSEYLPAASLRLPTRIGRLVDRYVASSAPGHQTSFQRIREPKMTRPRVYGRPYSTNISEPSMVTTGVCSCGLARRPCARAPRQPRTMMVASTRNAAALRVLMIWLPQNSLPQRTGGSSSPCPLVLRGFRS